MIKEKRGTHEFSWQRQFKKGRHPLRRKCPASVCGRKGKKSAVKTRILGKGGPDGRLRRGFRSGFYFEKD